MEFRILGTLEVSAGDGAPIHVGGARQRALLAILLLHANEVVPVDRLIDELWGARPPATALKALQVHVSQLRKLLEPGVLATRPPGYVISLEPAQLDSRVFEDLVEEAGRDASAGNPRAAADALSRALALWRGPALADVEYEAFAQAEIARLEELRLTALERRIDARLALGGHSDAIAELQSLVAREPLRERPRAQLMTALYRAGRQAEALEVYRDAQRALMDMGLAPAPELRELQSAILNQDPSLEPDREPAPAAGDATFVGRGSELERVHDRLAAAAAGRGGVVLVGGEPGIGKSRLLAKIAADAAARGAQVHWGRAWEAGGAPAYWPWVQVLRSCVRGGAPDALRRELGAGAADLAQILPELSELAEPSSSDSEGARIRLFDSISTFLARAAEARPLVLLVDDLHAADVPSLLLLQFLARQLPEARILVVAAYRDAAGGPGEPLARALVELSREPGVERLSLTGLDVPDVARYIELTAGLQPPDATVVRIQADTAGNPLFVGELVRLLEAEGQLEGVADERSARAPLPEGVRAVIARRLNRLSEDCLRLLTLASVLGRQFSLDALEQAAALPGDRFLDLLDEALEARVVGEPPGASRRLQFSHALVRDALYDDIAPGRRARLHRTVGETLERLYAPDPEPHLAELALHFTQAAARGDIAQGVDYARRAGDRAAALLAFEEAARLYELALRSLDLAATDDPVARCDLLLALGDVRMRAGDAAAAKSIFREVAALARESGTPEQLARAAFGYGGRFTWHRASSDPGMVPLLEDALVRLGGEDSGLRARLLARLACAMRDEPSRARRASLAGEALAMARRLGDKPTLVYVLEASHEATESADNIDVHAADLAALLALAEEIGDRERTFAAHEQLLASALQRGDSPSVNSHLDAMAHIDAELRQPPHHWLLATWRTILTLAGGDLQAAEEAIEKTQELGLKAESWNAVVSYRAQMFVLRREQGRLAELEDTLARSVAEWPALVRFRCMLAQLYAELGRTAEARDIYESLVTEELADWHPDAEWLFTMVVLADVGAALGDEQRAEIIYRALLPYTHYNALAHAEATLGSAARAAGALAGVIGRFEDAERHFEQAVEMNARIGARSWVAHTKHDFARVLLMRGAAGDADRARALLDEAAAGYAALGMRAWAERASKLLAQPA